MVDKYLYNNSGEITEKSATIASTGASDSGKIVALDGTGRLDVSFMPVGIAPEVASILASEGLSAGNFVNIWNNSGTANVRKADNTTIGKEAMGFVLAGVTIGNNATVYFEGTNTALAGLSPGKIFLGTNGGTTSNPPSGSGNIVQKLGTATSTTTLNFEPSQIIVLA